jgi:hypothetical protein
MIRSSQQGRATQIRPILLLVLLRIY